jgi:hypothetical protein
MKVSTYFTEKPTFEICVNPNVVVPACIDDDEEIYNRLSYNIHMPENEDYFLDVPPHMRSLKVYSASLGHKVTENSVLKICKLDIFYFVHGFQVDKFVFASRS